jgi:hypothetical protein
MLHFLSILRMHLDLGWVSYLIVTLLVGGMVIAGRSRDAGYGVREGSSLPVFYDPSNPRNHVAACGAWFEAG